MGAKGAVLWAGLGAGCLGFLRGGEVEVAEEGEEETREDAPVVGRRMRRMSATASRRGAEASGGGSMARDCEGMGFWWFEERGKTTRREVEQEARSQLLVWGPFGRGSTGLRGWWAGPRVLCLGLCKRERVLC